MARDDQFDAVAVCARVLPHPSYWGAVFFSCAVFSLTRHIEGCGGDLFTRECYIFGAARSLHALEKAGLFLMIFIYYEVEKKGGDEGGRAWKTGREMRYLLPSPRDFYHPSRERKNGHDMRQHSQCDFGLERGVQRSRKSRASPRRRGAPRLGSCRE